MIFDRPLYNFIFPTRDVCTACQIAYENRRRRLTDRQTKSLPCVFAKAHIHIGKAFWGVSQAGHDSLCRDVPHGTGTATCVCGYVYSVSLLPTKCCSPCFSLHPKLRGAKCRADLFRTRAQVEFDPHDISLDGQVAKSARCVFQCYSVCRILSRT